MFVKILVLIFSFAIVNIQMKTLEKKDQNYETMYAEDLKAVKLAVRIYAYYNDLLETNMLTNQAQKKQAQLNLQQVQTKLQNYMKKFKNNNYMISLALTEYANALKQINKQHNNVQPVFADEKKPFMWGQFILINLNEKLKHFFLSLVVNFSFIRRNNMNKNNSYKIINKEIKFHLD